MRITKNAFVCLREGLQIRGTVFKPITEAKYPAVILSHGFMSNQKSTWTYAKMLAKMGYAVFTFDFCGGCYKGSSDGKSEEMTVLTEVSDLNAVIDHVQCLPYVHRERIILMGCSQGGFVSALVAAQRKEVIHKLILLYPAFCIPDDARAGRMQRMEFDPNDIPQLISTFPMKIGRAYAATMLEVDPYREIAGYSGPVLLLHGAKDKVVSVSYAQKATRVYAENKCSLVVLEKVGHGFRGRAQRIAMDNICTFLQET